MGKLSRRLVSVGVIGIGPQWESHYLPALVRMQDRIDVCTVYDSVLNRAETAATQVHANVAGGISTLINDSRVRAVLLLDNAWYGGHALRIACQTQKPVYVVRGLRDEISALTALHHASSSNGLTVMPEFPLRYTPASGRLQELMATKLGYPRRVSLETATTEGCLTSDDLLGSEAESWLIGLIDWCYYTLRKRPHSVRISENGCAANDDSAAADGQHHMAIEIEFPAEKLNHSPPMRAASIVLPGKSPLTEYLHGRGNGHARELSRESMQSGQVRLAVECERGTAVLSPPCEIVWRHRGEEVQEQLDTERQAVDVMLDQFCRRVVGGLIPVADLNDICHSLRTIEAMIHSRQTGQRVELNGRLS